ncbi:MAG: RNA-binding S4 domain-containing protein [Ruminococcaceae bacterium]|nr:RNA-binding S4 domain-containing protein [Oscillospiraceae bacterium]
MEKQEKEIIIKTEYIKLDSFLKLSNICSSGGEAKMRILDGEFKVDGEVCLQRGKKLRPGMKVNAEGAEYIIKAEENKP